MWDAGEHSANLAAAVGSAFDGAGRGPTVFLCLFGVTLSSLLPELPRPASHLAPRPIMMPEPASSATPISAPLPPFSDTAAALGLGCRELASSEESGESSSELMIYAIIANERLVMSHYSLGGGDQLAGDVKAEPTRVGAPHQGGANSRSRRVQEGPQAGPPRLPKYAAMKSSAVVLLSVCLLAVATAPIDARQLRQEGRSPYAFLPCRGVFAPPSPASTAPVVRRVGLRDPHALIRFRGSG